MAQKEAYYLKCVTEDGRCTLDISQSHKGTLKAAATHAWRVCAKARFTVDPEVNWWQTTKHVGIKKYIISGDVVQPYHSNFSVAAAPHEQSRLRKGPLRLLLQHGAYVHREINGGGTSLYTAALRISCTAYSSIVCKVEAASYEQHPQGSIA